MGHTPPERISAWLADIEDWDSTDADVFMATLGAATAVVEEAPAARTIAS